MYLFSIPPWIYLRLRKVKVKVPQLCPTLCDPMDWLYSPWNSPGQNTGVGSLSLLQGDLPNPGTKLRSSTLQADSLPAETSRKPKNTGMDSLPLLQGIFPTQGSNPGLPHCRRLLYQPSHQGSPETEKDTAKPLTFEVPILYLEWNRELSVLQNRFRDLERRSRECFFFLKFV